jgi:hypothetical protein
MTPDMMQALEISGSILLAVVVLIVIISIVTVRRGEVEMAQIRKPGRSAH